MTHIIVIVLLVGLVFLIGWLKAHAEVEEEDEFFGGSIRDEDVPTVGDDIAVDLWGEGEVIWCRVVETEITCEDGVIVDCAAIVDPEDGEGELRVVLVDGYLEGVDPVWIPAEE